MNRYAAITGWGMALPERTLTNAELAQMVETDDEWIVSRTGIHERRIAGEGETSASLGTKAALAALEKANLAPEAVNLIIVATSSPEHVFPATACLIQDAIGAAKAGAFDLSAACSGFIYGLNMATQAIRSGQIDTALVIGSETLSRLVNWKDRNTCVLFGDGAGAFVLQASEEPGGVLSAVMRSDGSGAGALSIPAGGSYMPTSLETVQQGLHYIQMNGREVFCFATRVMASATRETVAKASLELGDVALIVPHQANRRIIEAAARELNFPLEKVVINIERYGNTSTASIPIAVCEAAKEGRLQAGDKVVLVGFGAGLTWGAALVHWRDPFPTKRKLHTGQLRWRAKLRSFLLRWLRRLDAMIFGR